MPNARNHAIVQVAFADDGTLSGAIDLGGNRIFAIQIPSSWTAADITFDGSASGATYAPVYYGDDSELVIQAAASRYVVLTAAQAAALLGLRYLKVRSGTNGSPVQQAGGPLTVDLITIPA